MRHIDFDLQSELATRRYCGLDRCRTEARYRMMSHNQTSDQRHEFLAVAIFLARAVGPGTITRWGTVIMQAGTWVTPGAQVCGRPFTHTFRFSLACESTALIF